MRRAIVMVAAALLMGLVGCGGDPADSTEVVAPTGPQAETTDAAKPTTTTPPRPTTTTTRPRPTTTTTTTAPPPPTTAAPRAPAGGGCDPNYSGACVPIASDVDCSSGGGNGPAYVDGPVTIVGTDVYGLDGGGIPGVGCES